MLNVAIVLGVLSSILVGVVVRQWLLIRELHQEVTDLDDQLTRNVAEDIIEVGRVRALQVELRIREREVISLEKLIAELTQKNEEHEASLAMLMQELVG